MQDCTVCCGQPGAKAKLSPDRQNPSERAEFPRAGGAPSGRADPQRCPRRAEATLPRSARRTTFPRRRRAAGRCDWPGAGWLSVAVRQVPPAGAEHGAGCRGSAAAAAPAGRGLPPPAAAAAPAPPLRTARGRTEKEGGRDVPCFAIAPGRGCPVALPPSPESPCSRPPGDPALLRPRSLPSPVQDAGGAGGAGQAVPLPCPAPLGR